MKGAVRIRRNALAKIVEDADRRPQEECCGLLAGRDGMVARAFAATNAAADTTTNYEIAPEELFRLIREIRAAGLELMGIYHSHPRGGNEVSPRDIERAYYPDVAYFILARRGTEASVRAFSIRDGRVDELKIEIE